MDGVFSDFDAFELRDFLFTLPTQPSPLTRAAWDQSSTAAKLDFCAARLRYIRSDFIVATTELTTAVDEILNVQDRNEHRSWGRYAVLIDGPSGAGKTTALVAAGADITMRGNSSDPPIVMGVEVPPKATPKALLEEFARSIPVEPPRRATLSQLMTIVTENLNAQGTQRVLVDEIQHLAYRNQAAVDAANMLKALTNKVKATFVYAGVNIKDGPLMAGTHGQQLARRSVRVPLSTMTLATDEGERYWRKAVRAFEQRMGLMDHPPGTLATESRYLFDRTGGSIGTLRNLLVDVSSALIQQHVKQLQQGLSAPGFVERIDRAMLDAARTDLGAELIQAYSTTGRRAA